MKVSGIGRNYNIQSTSFRSNQPNNTTSPIAKQNFATPTLAQLQSYSNVSFKGKEEETEVLDFINGLKPKIDTIAKFSPGTPVEKIQNLFASKPDDLKSFLLEERKFPALVLATGEQIDAFAAILDKEAPEVIAEAITIQDRDGRTPLHGAGVNKIESLAKAMGDRAPEAIAKAITIQDKNGNTALHVVYSAKEIEAIVKALGDRAPEAIAKAIKIQNKYGGDTVLHNIRKNVYDYVNAIATLVKPLKETPEVMADVMTIENNTGTTILDLSGASQIMAFGNIFKENTDKIFMKALLTEDKFGYLPIYPSHHCSTYELAALIEVAPKATEKALSQVHDTGCSYAELWEKELQK